MIELNEGLIEELSNRVKKLEDKFDDHEHNGYDSKRVPISNLSLVSYGHMYSNTPTTITVSVADMWYEIGSGITGGEINHAMFGGAHYIKIGMTGKYLINYSAALNTGTADQEILSAIMVNGSAQETTHGHSTVVTANKSSTVAGTLIINLTAGDEISLAVQNHTLNTNIVVEHSQLSLVRII